MEDGAEQLSLVAVPPDWRSHWWGMPAYDLKDATPAQSIVVNFMSFDDVLEFAQRLGLRVSRRTDSLWFPPDVTVRPSAWEYADDS